MSSIVNRLMGNAPTNDDVIVLDLQLRLLVAMAAADKRISPLERRQIYDFIARNSISAQDEERLLATADRYLAAPPRFEDLRAELSIYADRDDLADVLTTELADVAHSDDVIDHREELLFTSVCQLFGVPARPLLPGAESLDVLELRGFVERLAAGAWFK